MTGIFDRRRLQSHVRIWRGDVPVGSGFVVGPRHVMTCAHVVADSAGQRAQLRGRAEPPLDVSVRMDSAMAPGRYFVGKVVPSAWRPEIGSECEEIDDIAVIEICEGDLPPSALPVGKTRAVRDDDWIVGYGVAPKLAAGVIIRGRFQGSIHNRFLIASDAVDEAVRPGCSGAAAWNSMLGGVAGMIAEMQQTQTGRVIPVDLLEQVWPFEWEEVVRREEPLPPEPSAADLQLKGLDALASSRATRELLTVYGADIRRSGECANVVGGLKRLHDLVDRLRRNVYAPLRSIVQRLPAPDAFRDVAQQRGVFLDLRGKIAATAGPPNFEDGEFPWVDEQLAYAAEDLKQALEEQRDDLVAGANENLRQVVEVELSSLDTRIVEAARELNLDALISRLHALRAELAAGGIAAAAIEALDRDVATLSQIEGRLSALIALHHDWQRVDAYLNGLETALSQSMQVVALNWRLLSRKLAKVCPVDGVETVPGLAAAVAAVGAAIEAGDSTRLWIALPDLATLVRDRFFGIDQELLQACASIGTAGSSLNSVVEKLDGGG